VTNKASTSLVPRPSPPSLLYLDVGWTRGGVAYSFCTAVKRLSETKKYCQDCLMSSPQSFHGSRLQSVMHSLTCLSENVPLLHTSTQRPGTSLHVISFTKPSSVLVLQATNTGVRRSGYKARHPPHYLFVPSISDDDYKGQMAHHILDY